MPRKKQAADQLVAEGVACFDRGAPDSALLKYNEALQLDQDNLSALAEKGMTLLSIQKADEAISSCERALKVHKDAPELSLVYVTLGNAWDMLGKPDKAIRFFDDGIKKFPAYHQLYFNKGITLVNLKKIDDALACF